MEGWVDLGYLAMHRPGTELATSRSRVQRPTTTLTEPLAVTKTYSVFLCKEDYSRLTALLSNTASCAKLQFPMSSLQITFVMTVTSLWMKTDNSHHPEVHCYNCRKWCVSKLERWTADPDDNSIVFVDATSFSCADGLNVVKYTQFNFFFDNFRFRTYTIHLSCLFVSLSAYVMHYCILLYNIVTVSIQATSVKYRINIHHTTLQLHATKQFVQYMYYLQLHNWFLEKCFKTNSPRLG